MQFSHLRPCLLVSLSTLAFCLCAVSATAEDIDISEAVAIEVTPETGQSYTVVSSEGVTNWTTEESGIGDGSPKTYFFPADQTRRYFRLESRDIDDLNATLEPIRAANDLPSLMAIAIVDHEIVGAGAVGNRKYGVTSPVTLNDKIHVGSLTKSMTAALTALLVEDGTVTWGTDTADVFTSLSLGFDSRYRSATLEMLLSNQSGTPNDIGFVWSQLWNHGGTPYGQRRMLLTEVLGRAPNRTPGTGYEYSNAGFAIAGHMLEEVTGTPWEELIQERLFRPLGITSAGTGPAAQPRHIDHPLGHTRGGSGPEPVDTGISADNPPAIGPAGTIHMSMVDFAKYAQFHLSGYTDDAQLLPAETIHYLHTPQFNGSTYALGWFRVSRAWAGELGALNHTGSNLQHFLNVWLAPSHGFAVIIYTNIGDAFSATDQVAGAVINRYL